MTPHSKPAKRAPKPRRPLPRSTQRIARKCPPRQQSQSKHAVARRKADREWAAAVKVRAQDLTGEVIQKDGEGFLARIYQHEIDHLDGILFIDRLAPELRKEAMKALRDQDFGMSPPPRAKASKTL